MITTVTLTFIIDNRGQNSFERTRFMKDTLVDLYDAIDLDSMGIYIRDIRYVSGAEIGADDILKVELDKRNLTDVKVFRKASWIAEQIGNVKKFQTERTDMTDMFIGLKIGIRMTADSRKDIGALLIPSIQRNRKRFVVDSVDLDDGTVFYLRDDGRIRPSWRVDLEAMTDFVGELENVYDYDDDPVYVIMKRVNNPTYHQVNLK